MGIKEEMVVWRTEFSAQAEEEMDFRLGRVFGIPVDLNISWLIIFVLLSYAVGFGYVALVHPAIADLHALGLGAAAALVLFVCLFAHELSHSLMARRFGIKTSSIRLFLLGGMAELEDEPKTWTGELAVALAGPAFSLACAGFFAAAWTTLAPGSMLSTLAFYLAFANGVLAALNLLPGLPLDGGRVLRSILWRLFSNRLGATRVSAWTGIALGLGMAGLGAAILVMEADPAGLWLIFVGWFINSAASQCWQRELARATPEEARRFGHGLIQVRQSGPMVPRLR